MLVLLTLYEWDVKNDNSYKNFYLNDNDFQQQHIIKDDRKSTIFIDVEIKDNRSE